VNEIQIHDFDIEQLRAPLCKMANDQLPDFGNAARYMCSPYANLGKAPRDVFVMQLREAKKSGDVDVGVALRRMSNPVQFGISPPETSRRPGKAFRTGLLRVKLVQWYEV
jgi:hypothetical protein